MRRHFFLVGAVVVLALMLVLGGVRLIFPAQAAGSGGPGGMGPPGGAAAGKMGKMGKMGGGPGGMAPQVTPAVATVRTFADRIEVLGAAKGRQSVTLTSNTTELVTRVRFSDGQYVQRGAVLADLQASEEDASIITARAAANQADRQYKRWKTLADKGIVSPAAMEQYQAASEQARANLLAAQSRRSDRVIRAPFSGVVGISNVAPGTLINPGAAVATLDDVSVIRVDFDIPDRFLPIIRQGQGIVARPDALPGRSFPGRIAVLDTRINEATRTIKARAEFANPGGELKPGMLVRVGIDQSQRQSVSVPESALLFSGDAASVYVIASQGDRTVAELRGVTLGVTNDGFVEIKSGLTAGERVVADGVSRVQPGQALRIAGAGGPPGMGGPPGAKGGRPPMDRAAPK